jgi:hypothetical protein
MDKGSGFQRDLAAMQDEMKNVAQIIEATRPSPVAKRVDVPLAERPAAPPIAAPKPSSPRSRKPVESVSSPTPLALPLQRSNVTTRLSAETNELLTEAALRQKLKRARPNTRQDIIEAAVGEWLQRHGYGRRRRVAEPPLEGFNEGVAAEVQSAASESPAGSEGE